MAIKIKYNGAVIASLGAGQTITLKCAGMKMLSDVVVEADEQGGNDKPSIAAGLYTDNTYSTMTTSWQELLDAGVVHVDDGVVYTNCDFDAGTNGSSYALVGVLILPNDGSITKIGDFDFYEWAGNMAFSFCEGLTGIIIPETVTSVSAYAFINCTSLTSIEIPDSVESIGDQAFDSCANLTNVYFGENCKLTNLGAYTFYNCASLTSIEIPDGVTTIGDSTFYNCSSLEDINLPANATHIGENAFHNCPLRSVEIPACVTNIGTNAFSDCSVLTCVTFGENSQLNTIGSNAFWYCTGLTSISIPDSVTAIMESAFGNCESLENVTVLSETPPSLDVFVFVNVDLTAIQVPASSIDAYKAADGWSEYADIIVAI